MDTQQLIDRLLAIEVDGNREPDVRRIASEERVALMGAIQQVERAEGHAASAERKRRMGGNVFGEAGVEGARAHLRKRIDDASRVIQTYER